MGLIRENKAGGSHKVSLNVNHEDEISIDNIFNFFLRIILNSVVHSSVLSGNSQFSTFPCIFAQTL